MVLAQAAHLAMSLFEHGWQTGTSRHPRAMNGARFAQTAGRHGDASR
jgi:hypothetical protein